MLVTMASKVCLIVEINGGGARTSAHLLEFDSVHGRWRRGEVSYDGESISVGDDHKMAFSSAATIEDMDLNGIDMVWECTGERKTAKSLAPYFAKGVSRVIVSAPLKGPIDPAQHIDVVYGVNDHLLTPSHTIVTAASCTTTASLPSLLLFKTLSAFGTASLPLFTTSPTRKSSSTRAPI